MKKIDKKALKQQSHALKPVVMTGTNGLTPAVQQEIDQALQAHELIKIKLVADREERQAMTKIIIEAQGAELINQIGQMIVIYRERKE